MHFSSISFYFIFTIIAFILFTQNIGFSLFYLSTFSLRKQFKKGICLKKSAFQEDFFGDFSFQRFYSPLTSSNPLGRYLFTLRLNSKISSSFNLIFFSLSK